MMQLMCSEHKIHKRETLKKPLSNFSLLHHATAYAYQETRFVLLPLFKRSNVAEHALFSMFAHTTCVEQQQGRFFL